ncbi:hypothetical protein E2562_036446 [Oryza meyeriana var. granulata]|uniref:Uncharacterized protein n=1 Tax=Oryza meyeriana var. granulata TaxID=110450 RepID=A0A6G1D9P5_9ORYZ|nr:hypothetical protein E2562_036446 [Oryza meyeriana var. granulata]
MGCPAVGLAISWGQPPWACAVPAGPHGLCRPVLLPPSAAPPADPTCQPEWDQAGLVAALNQMQLHSPSPWVLDTGATSHMSSSDGILDDSSTPAVTPFSMGVEQPRPSSVAPSAADIEQPLPSVAAPSPKVE